MAIFPTQISMNVMREAITVTSMLFVSIQTHHIFANVIMDTLELEYLGTVKVCGNDKFYFWFRCFVLKILSSKNFDGC